MNKMNELFYAGLPKLAFIAFTIRLVTFGASIGDSIALLGLCGLIAYQFFIEPKRMSEFENLKQEVALLKNAVSSLKIERAFQQNNHQKGNLNGQKTEFTEQSGKRWF